MLTRAILTRFTRTPPKARAAGGRHLRAAALGLGTLWLGVVALAVAGMEGAPLLVLSGIGLLGTVALLPLAHQQQVTKLRGLAATDALTDLTNHRGFQEVLAAELERARRAARPVALVMMDLDNFKSVNDTHGHPYGDEVLREVGKKLGGVVRATDTAARVGGEEFALILPGTGGEVAYRIAERAREAVAEVPVRELALSCSAGIATYPADAEDASSLCKLADGALYWAKRQGKQRTRRFDPEHVASASDQQAAEIAAVIADPEGIKSAFQPVVDLASGHLVGYEALARFEGSQGRSPQAWFARAHSCGLGPELDAAAIRAALAPVGRPIDTHLALNVSPSALTSEPVAEALPADLSGLVIEITEHEFVPDDETLAGAVAELRDRGARIAIDDAGAGYAGLKQMMRVRPDIVKLDRRPDQAHPCRPSQDGAGRVLRPLRTTHRRHRVRRGNREPRRPRGGQRPRRPVGTGLRPWPSGGAVGARLAGRRRRSAGQHWRRRSVPARRATEGSPPATAGSSTSAPGWPAPAHERTSRAPWP